MQTLTVSVAELLGQPGKYRDISISQPLDGLTTALSWVDDTPVGGSLRAESVVEGILVTGRIRAGVGARCARCLRDLSSDVEIEVCELFAAPGSRDVPEDSYRISGTEMNLEPMVRDALTLALPLNPLCSRDCKGICSGCGTDLNVSDCVCVQEETDPRWAPLDALRARLENQGA